MSTVTTSLGMEIPPSPPLISTAQAATTSQCTDGLYQKTAPPYVVLVGFERNIFDSLSTPFGENPRPPEEHAYPGKCTPLYHTVLTCENSTNYTCYICSSSRIGAS